MKSNPRPPNPLLRHWRGNYSLFLSAGLFLIGIRVAIGWLQTHLQPIATNVELTAWLTVSMMILVWQLVGGLRACDNHIKAGGGMVAGWLGYAALLITLSLASIQLIDGVTHQIELQPAPEADVIEIELLNNGTEILVDRVLDWALFSSFKNTLAQHSSIKTVVLNSTGGRVFTARGMALLIEQYNLDTHVRHQCYSACTLLFLAGNYRTMDGNASLGFHRYSMQEQSQLQAIDIALELKKDKAYFLQRGVSAEFVNAVFQADSNQLWIPDSETLFTAGVIKARKR